MHALKTLLIILALLTVGLNVVLVAAGLMDSSTDLPTSGKLAMLFPVLSRALVFASIMIWAAHLISPLRFLSVTGGKICFVILNIFLTIATLISVVGIIFAIKRMSELSASIPPHQYYMSSLLSVAVAILLIIISIHVLMAPNTSERSHG